MCVGMYVLAVPAAVCAVLKTSKTCSNCEVQQAYTPTVSGETINSEF